VIGQKLSARLFQKEDPIGKSIKCGDIWFTVCGIIKDLNTSGKLSELGMDLSQNDVFAPLTSVLSRYNDRARITSESISRRGRRRSSSSTEESNRNQLDKITVQVTDSRYLSPTAEVLSRMILRRHSGAQDFEITIPELLLKQEQRTKDIFNIVLGAIASISLIVGGIGIMNIMLASVMERIREIGVRLAIGARKRDIVMQFLMESTLISLAGGIIGILLGVIFAKLIMKITGILTIISVVSIVISFGVSAGVGILFGYMPAKRASEQDPVTSLRHD
jgi:putative ABC transport system permease protein